MDDDLCWECGENEAEGECPDCDDGTEYCGACLRDHKALDHDDAE